MATRKLGDVAVGEIVKLKENGSPAEYLVVNRLISTTIVAMQHG